MNANVMQKLLRLFVLGIFSVGSPYSNVQCQTPELPKVNVLQLTHDGAFKQRPVWSPDGQLVCFARYSSGKFQLWTRNRKSLHERRLTSRETPEYDASFAPDGQRLVFCAVSQTPGQGNLDLCTIGVEDQSSKHLIGDSGKLSHEESPSWSPDGKHIAFTSTRDGNQEIYLLDADGQNLRRVTQDPGLDAHPTWTPDGKKILFATNRWGDFEIAAVDPAGTQVERLTFAKGLDDYPVCSPDGQQIAFVSLRSGNFEVYIMQRDGRGAITNFSNDPGLDNFPAWTPQGELSWVSNRTGDFELYLTEGKLVASNQLGKSPNRRLVHHESETVFRTSFAMVRKIRKSPLADVQ